MQEYRKIFITKDEVVPIAERMKKAGVFLSMIHAFIDKDGKGNVSYEYEVGTGIESYTVCGENTLPSIESIYDLGAQWPEREIMELMPITFEGLDTSKRLFMPDNMIAGQGQILVTPMKELISKVQGKEDE
ncbi:MAG TPA: NADH-quinone oxidoreductase subunit C [Bacillota bacterium]|nr:NADH-quinone oxidoreductase subunit C [Bacillota bacterium]HQC36299.1 NADH-quinone oxidoreductase subunit C [Bacillota bacterium]